MLAELFNITFTAECVVFLASIFLLDKKTGIWRLFILFLLLTLVTEIIGWWLTSFAHKSNNSWVYNILLIISGIFTLYIIKHADPVVRIGSFLNIGVIFFAGFALVNLLFFEGIWIYNGYTEMVADIMIFIYCCYFFYRVLEEEVYRDLFRYEYFWIAIGFLFSSLGSVVLYIYLEPLMSYYRHTHINIYGYINYGLNVVLYGSLIISFICRKRNTRLLRAS